MIRATIVWVAAAGMGCALEREQPDPVSCLTWESDARALLEQRCSTCHSGPRPAGQWDVGTYHLVLDSGSDEVPNAIAGDRRSLMLTKIDPPSADSFHRFPEEVRAQLFEWVVDCRLALRDSRIHEPGIQNPRDPEFHGILIQKSGFDFSFCTNCHGGNFSGGRAKASCLSCHSEGPTDCATCHRGNIDPEHDAHQAYDCSVCHQVPSRWDQAGHLDPPPAEVTFSGLGARFSGASWQGGSCKEVYCHGVFEPTWEVGIGQGACGTCHLNPPDGHASDRCEHCHQRQGGHLDGEVQIGRSETGCQGCHGTESTPEPPPSLSGTASISSVGVGAHQAHLEPTLRLRRPLRCQDCHLVPEMVTSPGHIDSPLPAEVFPEAIREQSVAFAGGNNAFWDRRTLTCVEYCHGGRSPVWNDIGPQVFCGSCHAIPPTDMTHDPVWDVFGCVDCHSSAIDPFGNPFPEEHIDGDTDF